MRSLTFSLLLVVLVSIFSLGLLLDALFSRVSDTGEDHLSVVTSIGSEMAQALNNVSNLDEFMSSSGYAATVTPVDEFSLPESIKTQLTSGEPVVLESDTGLSLNYYLENHQVILSLDSIPAIETCLLYTSPSPRDATLSRMPSSA